MSRRTRHRRVNLATILWTGLLLAFASLPCLAEPVFPNSGYNLLLVDPQEPAIPDNVDVLNVGYQADGTYAYFRVEVAGQASFASDRYYLYLDLDHDGLADRRMQNTSAANAEIQQWAGAAWSRLKSIWCIDPDDSPDHQIYMATELPDVNNGDFDLRIAATDQPSHRPLSRDPTTDPNVIELAPDWGTVNPTAVEAFDFAAGGDGKLVRLRWRGGVDLGLAGFNVYFVPAGDAAACTVNAELVPITDAATYELLDAQPAPGTYRLEVVRLDGDSHTVATTPSPEQ